MQYVPRWALKIGTRATRKLIAPVKPINNEARGSAQFPLELYSGKYREIIWNLGMSDAFSMFYSEQRNRSDEIHATIHDRLLLAQGHGADELYRWVQKRKRRRNLGWLRNVGRTHLGRVTEDAIRFQRYGRFTSLAFFCLLHREISV